MATATMGLRRRVQVVGGGGGGASNNSSGGGTKRTRSENNNSPSQGNLNGDAEPAAKRSRGANASSSSSTTATATASSPAISTRSKSKELEMAARKVSSNGLPLWPESRNYASIAGLSLGAQAALCSEAAVGGLAASAIPAYMSGSTLATLVGTAGAGKGAQGAGAAAAAAAAAAAPVSYLDISNMTARAAVAAAAAAGGRWPGAEAVAAALDPIKGGLRYSAPFVAAIAEAVAASTATSTSSSSSTSEAARESPTSTTTATTAASTGASAEVTTTTTSATTAASSSSCCPPNKSFPNDSMFAAYQPWVIRTYGDLAKTKTITIKKYARILRTLRGEEANSAENSKFRFWVKSKGFHVGRPEGYDAKPADRIVGRHAVDGPGLDPPLYVPTQQPHNKALNGAEGTVPAGRVYKKVAIVENFFDIIHAVHVDLEGRPGKHAGQKRTYRTITETYAFLPREAVTRFLLGCTECQRRPRTPSPTSLVAAATSTTSTPGTGSKPGTPTPASTPTPPAAPATPEAPPSPSPRPDSTQACDTSDDVEIVEDDEDERKDDVKVKEEPASDVKRAGLASTGDADQLPPESPPAATTASSSAATTPVAAVGVGSGGVGPSEANVAPATSSSVSVTATSSAAAAAAPTTKVKDEKYNPLSITNLLRKDPIVKRPPLPSVSPVAQLPPPLKPEPAEPCATTTSLGGPSRTPSPPAPAAVPRKLRILGPEGGRRSGPPSPLVAAASGTMVGLLPYHQLQQQQLQQHHQQHPTAAWRYGQLDYPALLPLGGLVHYPQPRFEPPLHDTGAEAEHSPAAGLIDTNLNLLATIQQLHCQVMLALTERMRPADPGSPAMAAAATAPPATTTMSTSTAAASPGQHGTPANDS